MRFEDLTFNNSPEGVQRSTAQFGAYQLSVILEPGKSLYEIAVFDTDNNFVQLPGIHATNTDFVDDVIPYLTEEQVTGIMLKLSCIAGAETV